METVDFLSSKDLKWWFAGLLIVLALSASFVFKILLRYHQENIAGMQTQLSEQRTTNKELNSQLVTYITTDHQNSIKAQQDTASALRDLSQAIKNFPVPQITK